MASQYFLDESGNTGDLVKLPLDLNFDSQPLFSLSCVEVVDCDGLAKHIDELKLKHKVKADELKSKKLYKSKPYFILDLFKYIKNEKLPFYIEVVDKRYCIASSIVIHQVVPSYFQLFDSEAQAQGFRNELSGYLSEHLTLDCYEAFFESCMFKSETSLLNSMKKLRDYFRSREFNFRHKHEALRCVQETIRFYHRNKSSKYDLVKNLTPIADIAKGGNNIHLLPHVHSWFNLIAKVNKHHNGDISDVKFFHDQQRQFDEILMYCSGHIKKYAEYTEEDNLDPTTNFNIKEDISLYFPDSKNSSGIQLADMLAGFFSRYIMGFLYHEDIDEIYHDIFRTLRECYGDNNFGVNFVIPIDKANKLFKKFDL